MSLRKKIANFFGFTTRADRVEEQETKTSCQRDSDRIISAEKKQAEASIRHRQAVDKFQKQLAENDTLSGRIMQNLKTKKIDKGLDLDEHDTTEAVGLF